MTYTIVPKNMVANWNILVVGCGGTGGYVAEGLCRVLIGHPAPIYLVDPDRVEEHNLLRQNFYPGEVGKFKSQALAERLSRQYGRPVRYTVFPYANDLVAHDMGGGLVRPMAQGLIIGCVDNAAARRSIAEDFQWHNWWLDAGNGRSSGQVLIGNRAETAGPAFDETKHQVEWLPLPSTQEPALLIPTPPEPQRDCAEAVAADEQSPDINPAMAALVGTMVYKFLTGKLTWMGAYIDLDAMTLQGVPARPESVARMLGVKVDTLMITGAPMATGELLLLRR